MKRTYVFPIVLVFILVTLLWWPLVIAPKSEQVDRANGRTEAAGLRQSQLQTQIAQLQAIKDNEISYRLAIGHMESSIPKTPQADVFIEDLTFLADTTGVDIRSLTMTPPAPNEVGGYEVAASLSIDGEYFEVLGFLYGIEALDRLVVVESIALTPAPRLGTSPSVTADGMDSTPLEIASPSNLGGEIVVRIFARQFATGGDGEVGLADIDEISEDGEV